ncbi:MAG: phosphomannose isomerase type II C-terminal cupin domain [Nanoarchaeota archaeon]|nr:phosphomannose isomerase type II C-terminal cupin domain [Nanoarchaeota archaeon]MBU1988496.1 phosphomannose isomerase type II C-terminal cupin domain [Nanoarchaeota archaeon]
MKKRVDKKPWGGFVRLTLDEKSTVKILMIKPKQRFSLQYHQNRKEFWKIIDNPVKITIGKKTFKAKRGDEFLIPKKALHRAEAFSKSVQILEISFGKFDEKDIVRTEDDYGRV